MTKNVALEFGILGLLCLGLLNCSGVKVVNPDQTKDSGTKMVDWSGGVPKVVSTYSCSIVASNGKRVSALGKSEAEARQEALAKCRDQTLASFCLEKNLSCVQN
jgi:hypothetical protein